MSSSKRLSLAGTRPASLQARAADDLRFIRATMERAAAFTLVPGWGGVLMGITGLAGSAVASRAQSPAAWLGTWLLTAAIAFLIGLADIVQKARTSGASLSSASASGFALALLPVFFAGACLTWAFARAGLHEYLAGLWLLAYGAGVVAASAFTVRAVRWVGVAFLAAGAVALLVPATWANGCLAAGFGGIHVVFGLWIARHGDG